MLWKVFYAYCNFQTPSLSYKYMDIFKQYLSKIYDFMILCLALLLIVRQSSGSLWLKKITSTPYGIWMDCILVRCINKRAQELRKKIRGDRWMAFQRLLLSGHVAWTVCAFPWGMCKSLWWIMILVIILIMELNKAVGCNTYENYIKVHIITADT